MMLFDRVVIGTRKSRLARVQSEYIAMLLQQRNPGLAVELFEIITEGDRTQSQGIALPSIGGKGLFTQELEAAITSNECALAVHSLKDLPTEMSPGLIIAAIPPRAPVADVLVSRGNIPFQNLAPGARVGTSSLRRETQLRRMRGDLKYVPIRGNVDTRIKKVEQGEFDCCVLAEAGLTRLGLQEKIAERFPIAQLLPAPGQGALAVQCSASRPEIVALLEQLDDLPTRLAVTAERSFLLELNAGCSTPLAAFAEVRGDVLSLSVQAVSSDGTRVVRCNGEQPLHGDPVAAARELGLRVATESRAKGIMTIV